MARLLDRVRTKYRKKTLIDRTLTRIRAIEEYKKLLVGLWLE